MTGRPAPLSPFEEEMSGRTEGGAEPPLLSRAARAVLDERARQIEEEGFTAEHDDRHLWGELAIAAACYALNASDDSDGPEVRFVAAELWPWEDEWWKPTDPHRDLVRAAALIIAELERLDRAAEMEAEDLA